MEVYQAAERYQEQLSQLIIKGSSSGTNVWHVLPTEDDFGEPCYMLMLNSMLDFGVGDDHFITKQRGGIRLFRTLDACASVLRQIGQDRMEVML